MKAKKIEIEREAHLSLMRQFKDDLVVHSSCTDMDGGYIETTWGIDLLDAPFIGTLHIWNVECEEREDARVYYYLYAPSRKVGDEL